MPRLIENDRLSTIGMIQAGLLHRTGATQFSVHINTIQALWRRFQQFGTVRDRKHAGCPCVMSQQQDNHIRLEHLRNCFQTASLTAQTIPGLRVIIHRTVQNRLSERGIRPYRPVVHPVLLRRHHVGRFAWCRRHLRFNRRDWVSILFTDKSRFHLDSSNSLSRSIVTLETF